MNISNNLKTLGKALLNVGKEIAKIPVSIGKDIRQEIAIRKELAEYRKTIIERNNDTPSK